MLAMLIVTQNEAGLLAWNLRHHLEYGVDVIVVADNNSTDETREVANGFGSDVRYIQFDNFHERQTVRHTMARRLVEETGGRLEWAAICDTDEFFWSPRASLREMLAEAPADIVAVNFDAKLYLPTQLDATTGPVFARHTYRTARDDSSLHTSYREGKTFYRTSWLTSLPVDHNCPPHEHLCTEVPHPMYRPPERVVHHYMIQDEDQFVDKAVRLINWAKPPKGKLAAARWKMTPPRKRALPGWSAQFKKDWWGAYQEGGEAGVREYYRTVYTIPADRIPEFEASGDLVHDDAFARHAARYLEGERT